MNVKTSKLCLIALLVLFSGLIRVYGQSAIDLRINEFLVENNTNYIDDFGQHSPWIEIFNSAYNPVDMGGLYLTDDLSNPTKYRIARGQQITKLEPRGYLVFWANNQSTHGIRHLNFILEEGKTIALFDASGKILIDSVTIPRNMQTDVTYGRVLDGTEEWAYLAKSTPGANNDTEFRPMSGDLFVQVDPRGFGMAIISMTVVFFALALLYLFFKNVSKLLAVNIDKQRIAKALTQARIGRATEKDLPAPEKVQIFPISGEVNAAIAMTLYLYTTELHDEESTILTINKVSRTYSPWSSKIYGLRKFPN